MRDSLEYRLLPSRSNEEGLLEELDGLVGMSLRKPALKICRLILQQDDFSPEAFREVVNTLGLFGTSKTWAPRMEASYVRSSRKMRRSLDGSMLVFFGAFNDLKSAARFAGVRKNWRADEVAFCMEALIHTGRIREARRLEGVAQRALLAIFEGPASASESTEFEAGFFLHAIACCQARTDRWREAREYWSYIPIEHPLGGVALMAGIDLYLCHSQRLTEQAAEVLRETIKNQPLELALPGACDRAHEELLRRVSRYRKTLRSLVPDSRRKEFGMEDGNK
jgi:hypothetical protein